LNFEFQIALGTSAGATNILNWTSTGAAETYSNSSLSLTLGSQIFATVRIRDSAGTIYQTLQGNGWYVVSLVNSTARYSIAPNWNTYALRSNTTLTCPNGTTYFSCIHGGESRRVSFPTAATCVGYTASDSLDAFYWGCDDSGGAGNVYFYSRSLKEDKGLSDLINATSWKNIRLVISQAGVPTAASAYTTWWTNPVIDLPTSASSSLVSGSIYTVSSNRAETSPYIFTGPAFSQLIGTSLVVLNGFKLISSGVTNGNGLISAYCSFCWFEGTFVSSDNSGDLFDGIINQSTIRKVRASNYGYLNSGGPSYSFINNVYLSNMLNAGIFLEGAQYNVWRNIHIDNSGSGIYQTDLEDGNIFQFITISHVTGQGIYFYSTQNVHYIGVTISEALLLPISMVGNTNAVLKNVALTNNANNSLTANADTRFTADNIVLGSTTLMMVSNSKFTNNLIFNGGSASCTVFGGATPGLVNTTCANSGSSNSVQFSQPNFGLTSYAGFVSSNDLTNQSDTLGAASYSTISDWLNFDNIFRSWSIDGGAGTAGVQGRCTSGNCRIFDYTLKTSDTQLKNSTAAVTTQNAPFVNGAACPAHLHGNETITSAKAASPIVYLKHATEIFGTGGNNNGLCETNETCLYLPNLGSYQGYGDFWTNSCNFTNGTITGVKMYAYPTN
jgi:hypothetical protein